MRRVEIPQGAATLDSVLGGEGRRGEPHRPLTKTEMSGPNGSRSIGAVFG
jgi:hypothetical protein